MNQTLPKLLRYRVVVADDHAVARRGVVASLAEMPEIEVCGEAADGQEAMKIVMKQKPDLLILGINLKSVGGFRVVRMLRLAVPETEVPAITLLDSAEVADVVMRAGARALITKSDPPEELLQAVGSVRRRHPYVTRNLVAKLREQAAIHRRPRCLPRLRLDFRRDRAGSRAPGDEVKG
jgi:two-component system nitrate/nitrite response regulator NarL